MLLYNHLDRDPRVWKEAATLAGRGLTVDVWSVQRGDQPAESEVDGFRVHRVTRRSPGSRLPHKVVGGSVDFWRRVRDRPVDVVHCHDGATLLVGVLLARRHRAALVYDAHEYFPDHLPIPAGASLLTRLRLRITTDRLMERMLIRRADVVITVSDGIADLLQRRFRLATRPVVVRNVGPSWTPPAKPDTLRRHAGIDDDLPLLVFHGMATPGRGLERCFDVLRYVPGAAFVVLGPVSSAYRADLIALATTLDVADRVHFADPVPYGRMLELLSTADVGLYLVDVDVRSMSYRYSLPNKVFEFVLAGLPVVVSDLPEIGSLVREHGLGWAVDTSDVHAIADALRRLLVDDAERAQIRARVQSASKVLTWDAEEERLLDAYARLAIGRR